jgi:hypothetical protein
MFFPVIVSLLFRWRFTRRNAVGLSLLPRPLPVAEP